MISTEAPASEPPIVDLRGLHKTYTFGESAVEVLCDVNLRIGAGEVVSLTGPSGSGKSTLLNILGCLDRPTAGAYRAAAMCPGCRVRPRPGCACISSGSSFSRST